MPLTQEAYPFYSDLPLSNPHATGKFILKSPYLPISAMLQPVFLLQLHLGGTTYLYGLMTGCMNSRNNSSAVPG